MESDTNTHYQIKTLEEADLSDYVINCMPGVFFLQTEEGKYLRWNKNFEKVSGYTAAEIATLNALSYFDEHELPKVLEKIKMAFEQGSANIEATIIRKDGTKVPYYFVGCGIIYNGQRCIIGCGADITEKIQAEEILQKSQAELHAIFDNTDTSYILLNDKFKILTINPIGFEKSKLFFKNGYSVGEDFIAKLPDERKEFALAQFNKVLAGETIEYELDTNAYDIGENCFAIKIIPIKGHDNKIYGICFSAIDITTRKIAEREIINSSLKYHSLFQQASDAIFICDFTGRFIDINDSMCNMVGYTRAELMGMNVSDLVEPGNLREKPIPYERLANGEHMLNNRTVMHKNGTLLDFEVNTKKLDENSIMSIARNVTEIRKVQRQVEISEATFRGAFEYSANGMAIVSLQGQWLRVNKELCNMLGYTPEELVKLSFQDITHPDDLAQDIAHLQQLNAGIIDTYRSEKRYLHKNGTTVYISLNVALIKDNNSKPLYFITQVEDITNKRKADARLKENEEQLRLFVEHSPAALAMLDTNLCYIIASKRWNTDYNLGPAPLVGKSHYDVFPDIPQRWKDIHTRCLTGQSAKNDEDPFVREDGTTEWVKWEIHPWYKANGTVGGIIMFTEVITKRKKEEQEKERTRYLLNERIKELTTLYRAGQLLQLDSSSIAETLQNLVDILPAGWQYPEITAAKITLDNVAYQTPNYAQGQHTQSAGFQLSNGTAGVIEVVYLTNKPELYEGPFAAEERNLINMLAEMLRNYLNRLRNERQREKITADLVQRNKDLEQFAYIISHNLRAPVANIIGFADVLKDSTTPEENKKLFINELANSVEKLDYVIRDLNSILQVKQQVSEIKEAVSFSKTLHNVEVSIANMITNEKVSIQSDFSAADEMLTLKSYIHSIFYNLITNSIKYRRPDVAPVIEIKSRKENGKIILVFTDNGMGIDMDKKGNQVFGMYKRFHTQAAEGKGIGLFMTKTQVETLGGNIHITSRVNEGTEFVIELPE